MLTPALSVRGLSLQYPGMEDPLLAGVDLDVAPGEVVGLLGANGSGKSTLCEALAGLVEPASGEVLLGGAWVADCQWHALQYVPQDVDAAIVAPTVYDDIAFTLENRGVLPADRPARVDELLTTVGLPGFARREVIYLSGGERQRLVLASALAAGPRCLVLDEVTAHLDAPSAESVLQIVRDVARRDGIAVVMVTQRLDECRWFDRVSVLAGGTLSAPRTPASVLYDTLLLERAYLSPPLVVRLVQELDARGVPVGDAPLAATDLPAVLGRCSA